MNEIIFRGFHQDDNVNEQIYINGVVVKGEWVYGYYCKYIKIISGECVAYDAIQEFCQNSDGIHSNHQIVISETLGQYKGVDG